MGVKVAFSPNVSLKVANAQLVTSNSAAKLEALAEQLQKQAEIIEKKDAAYRDLESAYEKYIKKGEGSINLDKKIEAIEDLPEASNINEITADIQETEEDLLEISE